MPFKTRRRKVSAASRRLSFSSLGSVTYKTAISESIDHKTGKNQVHKLTNDVEVGEVKSELVKIVLLAGLIIGLQIALKILHLQILG